MIQRPIVCRRLIGRRDELAFLHERRRDAGAGHGGLLLLAGEAGIGKSRLLAEFSATLVRSRYRVAQSACLEIAQRPYGPVLDLLATLDPRRGALVPAASKHEQFEAIVGSFKSVAMRSAVVAIIEDLHWADVATIELLIFLCSKLSTMRMLVVASLRPEEFHNEHPSYVGLATLSRTAGASRVLVQPLDHAERQLFIEDALGDIPLPRDTQRAVARASDGNPFFLEELLKNAVESSASAACITPGLPPTVHATVMARVRPLVAAEREVIRQAAVIGNQFDLGLLAETLETDTESLLPTLRRVRDLQLIEERGVSTFRFRHALTRDAIYEEFTSAQVRPLHRRIALTLANVPTEQRSIESLAYHWWAAGDREQSASYNEQAGDLAAAMHAHDDAITYYARAMEAVAGDDARRARLLEKVAERRIALADYAAAGNDYAAAAAAHAATGNIDGEARCRVRFALQQYTLGRAEPARELEAMLQRLPDDQAVALARIHVGIAWLAASFYDPTKATRHLDAVDRCALSGAPDVTVRYHNVRAWVAMLMGDIATFIREHRAWISAASEFASAGLLAAAHYNGAYCYALFGMHEEAERHSQAALDLGNRENSPHVIGSALGMRAFCAILCGDLNAAREHVSRVAALHLDNEVMYAHAAAWGTFAACHLDDNAMLDHWFDERRSSSASDFMEMAAAGYAEALARRGRLEEARTTLHAGIGNGERRRGDLLTMLAVARYGDEADVPRARAILEQAGDGPDEVVERHALLLFDAIALARTGQRARSARAASAAVPGLRRLRFPLLEAQALELAGDVEAARTLYARCGAAYDVRRLTGTKVRDASARRDAAATPAELSVREREVAKLVATGCSNLQIASQLQISQKTVEKHLGSAYQKLGFSSRAQLASYIARAEAV